MNVRLIGSRDLVRAIASALDAAGVPASTYPSRSGARTERLYIDLDDREAERLIARLLPHHKLEANS